jgi:hypothetical protein
LLIEQEMGGRNYQDYFPSDVIRVNNADELKTFLVHLNLNDIISFRQIETVPGLNHDALRSFARIFLAKVRTGHVPKIEVPFDYLAGDPTSPWGHTGLAGHSWMTGIARQLALLKIPENQITTAVFLYRALRYAGYASRIARETGSPVAYSASPGRIVGLQYLLTPDDVEFIEFCGTAYWDLIERLSLPAAAYDFSEFKGTFNPVLDSSLSYELMRMRPREALTRVLEIRNSAKGNAIREEWAELIWDRPTSSAHGTLHVSVRDVQAGGDVQTNVTIIGKSKETKMSRSQPSNNQNMSGIRSRSGGVMQESNLQVNQQMENIDAYGDVVQRLLSDRANDDQIDTLRQEILKVRDELAREQQASSKKAMEAIKGAIEAVEKRETNKAVSLLRSAGRVIGSVAKEAGAELIAHLVEKAAGL